MIKSEELSQMKARAEKATAGPWIRTHDCLIRTQNTEIVVAEAWRRVKGAEDAAFIAHAREDVPRLVAEVERLQSQEHFAEYAIRQNKALWEALSKACAVLGVDTLDYYEEDGGI